MPNGVSPSAPWVEKSLPQEKPIPPRGTPTVITSISRKEEPSTNISSSTSLRAKAYSNRNTSRKPESKLATSSSSFRENGTPTTLLPQKAGRATG